MKLEGFKGEYYNNTSRYLNHRIDKKKAAAIIV